ncbi:ABC transporter ATP-binding protein [bacterium]|nr:ABC transporter ATP-binding protein [bacterium]
MNKIIEIKNLNKSYSVATNFWGREQKFVHALNGINLEICENEILGLVGESGCGKSTLGKCVLKLEPITEGEILFKGKDISVLDKNETKEFRKKTSLIFQNPYMSLNPRMKIYDILREPFIVNSIRDKKIIRERINEVLNLIKLDQSDLAKYPHEFSGGQRQRIAIARAIMMNPDFIVADEPVSALDVSIQSQIINMIIDLKQKMNLTMLFVSHDLNIVKYVSDRVAVMYLGEIVEIGNKDELFENPKHPYTKALLSVVPKINDKGEKKIILQDDLPSPYELPKGCKFHTRCPFALERCKTEEPKYYSDTETHKTKCFLCE